jgi:hypothetical protein
MEHPSVVAVAMLPGIADLAPRPKYHFVRALIAERTGNWLLAAFELKQAVAAEALEASTSRVST